MTTPVTDATHALVDGFGQLLAAAGLGLTWNATGDVPGFAMTIPADVDTLAWSLTPYLYGQALTLTDSTADLQIRWRSADADPRPMWAAAAAVQKFLHGRWSHRLPTGLYVGTCQYTAGVSLGQQDAAPRRWEWSDRYALRLSI